MRCNFSLCLSWW